MRERGNKGNAAPFRDRIVRLRNLMGMNLNVGYVDIHQRRDVRKAVLVEVIIISTLRDPELL
jgi:hypothetical protein